MKKVFAGANTFDQSVYFKRLPASSGQKIKTETRKMRSAHRLYAAEKCRNPIFTKYILAQEKIKVNRFFLFRYKLIVFFTKVYLQ